MDELTFPDAISVEKNDADDVRIRFIYDGHPDPVTVVVDQSRLMKLISQLHEKIASAPLAPISLEKFQPGRRIDVRAYSAKKQPDGSLRIDLTAVFEDRLVTVPWTLSPTGADELRAELESD